MLIRAAAARWTAQWEYRTFLGVITSPFKGIASGPTISFASKAVAILTLSRPPHKLGPKNSRNPNRLAYDSHLLMSGGVVQALDLAGITSTAGAQFLCVFCEEPAPERSRRGRESE